jgi:Spherulation-specific family 4
VTSVVACAVAAVWLLLPSPSIADRPPASATSPVVQRLAVPAYADPVAEAVSWDQLAASTPGAVGIVVANVANGPGSQPDAGWTAVIHSARASGSRVLGYVDTGYLGSPSLTHPDGLPTRSGAYGVQAWLSQIESDIDAWYRFYGNEMGGIFLDEGTSACGPSAGSHQYADRYRTLRERLQTDHAGAVTVLNPGIVVPQCYRDAADVLVTFEGSYANYTGARDSQGQDYERLDWSPADPAQIWHIVYGAVSSEEMAHAMALSKQRGAGNVYVTDAGLPNPFGSLPPADYWDAEVAERAR